MRKTLSGNLKNIYIYFSQMSAVRTGVRAYMDAKLLLFVRQVASFKLHRTEDLRESVECFNWLTSTNRFQLYV